MLPSSQSPPNSAYLVSPPNSAPLTPPNFSSRPSSQFSTTPPFLLSPHRYRLPLNGGIGQSGGGMRIGLGIVENEPPMVLNGSSSVDGGSSSRDPLTGDGSGGNNLVTPPMSPNAHMHENGPIGGDSGIGASSLLNSPCKMELVQEHAGGGSSSLMMSRFSRDSAPNSPRVAGGSPEDQPRFSFSFARGHVNESNPSALLLPCHSAPHSRANSGNGNNHLHHLPGHAPAPSSNSLFALNSDGSGMHELGSRLKQDGHMLMSDIPYHPTIGVSRESSSGQSGEWARNTMELCDSSSSQNLFDAFPPMSMPMMERPPLPTTTVNAIHSPPYSTSSSAGGFHTPTTSTSHSSASSSASSVLSALLAQSQSQNLEGNVALQKKLESLYLQQNQQQQQLTPPHTARRLSIPTPPHMFPTLSTPLPVHTPPRSAAEEAVIKAAAVATRASAFYPSIPPTATVMGAPITRASFAAAAAATTSRANGHTTTTASPTFDQMATSSDSSSSTSFKSPSKSRPRSSVGMSCSSSPSPSRPAKKKPRIRNNGEPFLCDECGKTFTQKGGLQNHQRIHRGERPFVCEQPGCSRAFAQKCNLTRHQRCHTGEKPFKCTQCERAFNRRWGLLVHAKSHEAGGNNGSSSTSRRRTSSRRAMLSSKMKLLRPSSAKVVVLPFVSVKSQPALTSSSATSLSVNSSSVVAAAAVASHTPISTSSSSLTLRSHSTFPRPSLAVPASMTYAPLLTSSNHPPTTNSQPLLASQLASLHQAAAAFLKPPIPLHSTLAVTPTPLTNKVRSPRNIQVKIEKP